MSVVQLDSALLFDSNMYLILGSERTALIDTGTGFQMGPYIANIEKVLAGRPLDYVFITHRHYDHVGGLSAIIDRFSPSAVYAGAADAEPLRIGDSESTLGTKFGGSIPPMDVKDIREGDVFDLGDCRLRVIETPGHTIGSICLFDEVSRDLFSGDCFFVDGVGRCDHPTASPDDMRASLRKLRDIDFSGLYSGHGPVVKSDGKRFLEKAIQIMG
ncbi:MAG: MBL fold metallo-hydrolase [Candidatus Methanomethylophilaceae archaeon]|nr:MBL fold metallo-hydrolase [Candidatus Methanomethylophilaceae archaeon]